MTAKSTGNTRGRPLAVDRRAQIRRQLDNFGSVTVMDLAHGLNVAQETIRRDLKRLAKDGDVVVVHGGATRRRTVEPALAERTDDHAEAKRRIARAAAQIVPKRATILVDSGSTTLALANELARQPNLTIATNSLGVATISSRAGHRVIVLPGEVDRNDEATMSAITIDALDAFHFDIAFIGIGGISPDIGLTDYTMLGARFRSRLITHARASYLLADADKFHRPTPFPVANADQLTAMISDARPKGDLANWFKQRKIRTIKAE